MSDTLKEYRCAVCGKLLCKGILKSKDSELEVKCRGCGAICGFTGGEAAVIKKRSALIKQELIPDTDKTRVNFSKFQKLAVLIVLLAPLYYMVEDFAVAWPG